MTSRFGGFPPEAMTFLRGLERNNNRDWFGARKGIFEEKVKAPMKELVESVNGELARFAPDHVSDPQKAIYRIYRDTRFSRDKTPYKTHIGAIFPRRGLSKHGGAGYYFSVAPKGIEVAGGVYMPGAGELLIIRKHLAGHHRDFRRLIQSGRLRRLVGELQGEQLTRAPKGFPRDHAGVDLLRYKQWYFYVVLDPEPITTPKLHGEVMKRFRALRAFVDFLNAPLLERKQASRPDPLATSEPRSSRHRAL